MDGVVEKLEGPGLAAEGVAGDCHAMVEEVVVELKNDLSICGTLHSVDQYLNIKLTDISVTDPDKYPHMLSVKSCFIRGSVVRYVQLPADEVDTQLLQDAARKEVTQNKQ